MAVLYIILRNLTFISFTLLFKDIWIGYTKLDSFYKVMQGII